MARGKKTYRDNIAKDPPAGKSNGGKNKKGQDEEAKKAPAIPIEELCDFSACDETGDAQRWAKSDKFTSDGSTSRSQAVASDKVSSMKDMSVSGRTIPTCKFVESPAELCAGLQQKAKGEEWNGEADDVVTALQDLHAKYKYSESSLSMNSASLKEKIPEIDRALALVKQLISEREKFMEQENAGQSGNKSMFMNQNGECYNELVQMLKQQVADIDSMSKGEAIDREAASALEEKFETMHLGKVPDKCEIFDLQKFTAAMGAPDPSRVYNPSELECQKLADKLSAQKGEKMTQFEARDVIIAALEQEQDAERKKIFSNSKDDEQAKSALVSEEQVADETFKAQYLLAENCYTSAEIPKRNNTIFLWLGASTMLEYTYDEALALLTKNKVAAEYQFHRCKEDLEFVRAQAVVCDLNIARVHNYRQKLVLAEKKRADEAAEKLAADEE